MIRVPQQWAPPVTPPSPNEIAKAMTGRPHISYSEIRTFQQCPLRWRYQYVDHAKPEHISAALIMGSGVHAGVELHFENLLAATEPPTIDQMMTTFQECWDKETADLPVKYPKGQDAESTAATARRMFEEFITSPMATPTGVIIGIEESFKVKLADELPHLAGRVDMITHEPESNTLTITDFKTARSVWSQEHADEQAEQLILYAKGCEPIAADLGATIGLRYIVITKTKQPKIDAIDVAYEPNKVDRTRLIVRNAFEAMKTGTTYPVPSPMNCACCPFQNRCLRWHGEKLRYVSNSRESR